MINPLQWLVAKMPSSLVSIMDTPFTRDLYYRFDNAIIKVEKRICSPYYTKVVRSDRATFYCPTTKSWKMINRDMGAETPVISRMLRYVEERSYSSFYDIGANVGFFTCFIGEHVERTIAFEPYRPNVDLLLKNTDINNIDASVEEVALGNEHSKVELRIPITDKAGTQQATILGSHPLKHEFVKQTPVELIKLDDYIIEQKLPTPDIVKIDVEGAGISVLEGMETTLSDAKPTLFIEPHGNSTELKDFLESYDYTLSSVSPDREEEEHPTIIAE